MNRGCATLDRKTALTSLLLAGALALLGTLPSCICPNRECYTLQGAFANCVYPGNPEENTNKKYILLGPSSAAGGWCYQKDGVVKCGLIQRLEELTGEQIANFSLAALTASGVVENGYGRLDDSLLLNPGAERVYLMMGGYDVVSYFYDHPEEAPRPGANCHFDPCAPFLTDVIDSVRLLALRYKENGIQELIVSSFPPVEELGDHPFSCKSVAVNRGAEAAWLINECFNEVLEALSFLLYDMVQELGGAEAGIHFADPYHEFPAEPAECSLYCDCGHLNCEGHDLMAEIFHDALP